MSSREEIVHCLALEQIPGVGLANARTLFDVYGSAKELFERREEVLRMSQPTGRRLIASLECPEAFERAKRELEFAEKNGIEVITIGDGRYPSRLWECGDAPLALFFKGKADLNALRVINLVGTRNATDYGRQLCVRFMEDIRQLVPNGLVISGLAYGIDIAAHRAALENGLATIGVLAHGLDRIYPAVHRKTAIEMLNNGGLLTEYMSGTTPDRQNFVKRNRIVAGMCDATIVVESASKGGALITAGLAVGYNRDCFAFPGRVGDLMSQGCNMLIRENKAALIQTAEDFVEAMGWNSADMPTPQAVQRQLFVDLSAEEEHLMEVMKKYLAEGIQVNQLVVESGIPVNRVCALLFELEMKGLVRALAGGVYKVVC